MTDRRTVIAMFPGQGSQQPGMAHDLWRRFERAKQIFKQASEVFGEDLEQLCFGRPYATIRRTDHAQILIATVSIVTYELLSNEGIRPDVVLGHSAGEIAALFASGVVTLPDALYLATLRGRAMSRAASKHQGRMVAVRDIEKSALESTLAEHRRDRCLNIANYNAPTEFVVTGDSDAVTSLERALTSAGRGRVVDLEQQGAWHSAHMEEAKAQFAEEAHRISWKKPSVPLLLNYSGQYACDAAEIESQIVEVISGSVQWYPCLCKLAESSPRVFCEVGPNRVLKGLVRKCYRSITGLDYEAYSVNDIDSLSSFVQAQSPSRPKYCNCN